MTLGKIRQSSEIDWGEQPTLRDPNIIQDKIKKIIDNSQKLQLPLSMVEDNLDAIENEENVAEPTDVNLQKKKMNPIGLREQISRMDGLDWAKRMPFSIAEVTESGLLLLAANRLKKDKYETVAQLKQKIKEYEEIKQYAEPFYEEEKRLYRGLGLVNAGKNDEELTYKGLRTKELDKKIITDYLLEQQELVERGQTFGAKVFEGASYLPSWMIEFALTNGLAKIGNATAKEVGFKILRSYVKTKVGRAILKTAGWAGGAITRTSLGLQHRVAQEILTKRLEETKFRFGPNQELEIELPKEGWGATIARGWGSVVIEAASETAGGSISRGLNSVLGQIPVGGKIVNSVKNAWMKLSKNNTFAKFTELAFKKGGWNGIVGEIGEERLNTIMASVLSVEDYGAGEEAGWKERLVSGLKQDIENLPVELATLSLPAGIKYVGSQAESRIQRRRFKKELKSLVPKSKPIKFEDFTPRGRIKLPEIDAAEKKLRDSFEKDIINTTSTQETVTTMKNYLGIPYDRDLTLPEPVDSDIKFIDNLMKKHGIREPEGYDDFTKGDFVNIFKYLQMPEDIRHAHPEFDPVYRTQRGREVENAVLNTEFLNSLSPYYKLGVKEQKAVDKVLIEMEQNPEKWSKEITSEKKKFAVIKEGSKKASRTFDTAEEANKYIIEHPMVEYNIEERTIEESIRDKLDYEELEEKLSDRGFTDTAITAAVSVRRTLDNAIELLTAEMKESGVDKKEINKFRENILNYIPHKWYGKYRVVAKQDGETVFMSSTNRLNKKQEVRRVQDLYPDARVQVFKNYKASPSELNAVSPAAMRSVIDRVIDRSTVDEKTRVELQEAFEELRKSKGFGAHFIRRKNIPGWEEDLRRPIAEYFAGIAGFISKMHSMKGFAEGLSATRNKPNLNNYATEYINYVLTPHNEMQPLKRAAYSYYLWGNVKSASLNLTQNFILGWPILSKRTNMALPKLLIGMAKTGTGKLTQDEKDFLRSLEKTGYLVPQLSQEIAGYTGNPTMSRTRDKIRKVTDLFDVFRKMEEFNRRSMALSLYNSGITDIDEVADIVEEAHFHYGKGNRPVLARGKISPIMTFRSWGINYAQWLKNQAKEGNISSLGKSLGALALIGGIAGFPGWEIIRMFWNELFGEDPETSARAVLGESMGELIMRGAPTKIPVGEGISFTGSVGQADVIPTEIKDLPGVLSDIPSRYFRVSEDISAGNWTRALEDSVPEALSNPMAAYRLYKYGMHNRSGSQIIDLTSGEKVQLTPGEAIVKSLGYQPEKMSRQWRTWRAIQEMQEQELNRFQSWANRYILAGMTGDKEAGNEVINEIESFNNKMDRQGTPEKKLSVDRWKDFLRSRLKAANIPPKHLWPEIKKLLERRGEIPKRENSD